MGEASERDKPTNHDIISSYFIGPKSENMQDFRDNITTILDGIVKTRSLYQPNDKV